MEKLLTGFLIVLFSFGAVYAQDSLCVFEMKGSAFLKVKGSVEQLRKGSFFNEQSTLMLSDSDMTAIDGQGFAYRLSGSGEFKFGQVLKNKVLDEQKSLTAKYFKMIWNELLNRESGKTIIGGVFRGDIPMLYPPDSALVAGNSFHFKWNKPGEAEQSFFFLRNPETDEILKIGTNGNTLTLNNDIAFLAEGDEFEWSISAEAFPNLNNIPFYRFKKLNRESYGDRLSEYGELIADLKSLGLDEKAIAEKLCEAYGICKF